MTLAASAGCRGISPWGREQPGWLVVSDVDHTLLATPAETALAGACLRRLEGRGAATLLASSKTFAEMVALQDEAGLTPRPFLFENGRGIGWPLRDWPPRAPAAGLRLGGYGGIVAGASPAGLAPVLRELRSSLGLRFALAGELPPAELGGMLGLDGPRTRRALDRAASLPLVWQDDAAALERLRERLADHGLSAEPGGRLVHVAPCGGKGEAVAAIRPWLADLGLPATLRVLACGDAENDRSLLESAAIALVFHAPDGPPISLAPAGPAGWALRRSVVAGGPLAWLEAVESALAEAGAAAAAESR